jgi:hypothetical protein
MTNLQIKINLAHSFCFKVYKDMKTIIKLVLGAVLVGAFNLAQATQYTYNFSPAGLSTMDGLSYYTWGTTWSLPSGQTIVDATLTYSSLYLTTADANPPARFYSTLLNTAPKGLTTGYDGDNNAPNPTPGAGVFLLGTATFAGVGSGYASLVYDFANIANALSTLNAYIADGVIGLGFDPDCYYTNSGIAFTITTTDNNQPQTRVPDAASTAMLLGAAFAGIGIFRRKNK